MKCSHTQRFALIAALGWVTPCITTAAETRLPRPDYERTSGDPDWLAAAVQFHGHLGPWAVAGIRLGAAARDTVKAEGYFDVDVVCEGPFSKPPRRCFLDGVQVATGATWGKGNIRVVISSQVAVTVTNTRTGKTVTVCPKQPLLEMLSAIKPKEGTKPNHKHLERLARKIANTPAAELLAFKTAPARPKN